MMRENSFNLKDLNPGSMSVLKVRKILAEHAVRSVTSQADWRLGRPTDAEFAQHAIDPDLFTSEITAFSAQDEQLNILSTHAHTFIRNWKERQRELHGQRWQPETPADRLHAAFERVVVARLLRPEELNVVAAINEATLEVEGPASSYGSDVPADYDIELNLDMVHARTQLFEEIAQFTQSQTV